MNCKNLPRKWLTIVGLSIASATQAAEPGHPLDPLTVAEYRTVFAALKEENLIEGRTRLPLITLAEPSDKAAVWGWEPGDPMQRAAKVYVKNGPRHFESVSARPPSP